MQIVNLKFKFIDNIGGINIHLNDYINTDKIHLVFE